MKESLHYLLMANHLLFQKSLLAGIKDINLTPGQPKILDYLLFHDCAVQKEIAEACHIEPATITSVLLGMEKKGLIVRKNINGNRRSLYVCLTNKGKLLAEQVELRFGVIEKKALLGFNDEEKEMLTAFLTRINKNLINKGVVNDEKN
ncbi:MAG: MarR family transcriptional regulator [bacterium]|nr:MarR family transcriptional regulator [bacterium]